MSFFTRSATIGVCSGLRSTVTPAIVLWAAVTGRLDLPRPVGFLVRPQIAALAILGALGEIVVDKLPFVPSRTVLPVLAWRVATGAVLGGIIALDAGESALVGGLAGAAGAAGGTYGGVAARTALSRLPGVAEPFPGIAGDAVATGLSLWVVDR
jgi:uncharacterized membrane protein